MFMFKCCKPPKSEKPLVTALNLSSSLTLQCTQEELFGLRIPHRAERLPHDRNTYNCNFSNPPYECNSKERLSKSFMDLWSHILKIYEIFPDKIPDMVHQISLTGVVDNVEVNQSFTDMDSFHVFLAQNKLVSPQLLGSQLTLGYRFRITYEPVGTVAGGNLTPVCLESYETTLKNLQQEIYEYTSEVNPVKSVTVQLDLAGRIGVNYVTRSFDNLASLEEFLNNAIHYEDDSQLTQTH